MAHCSICSEKIKGVIHEIKLGKYGYNLCEDCFNVHINNISDFKFDYSEEDAANNYLNIFYNLYKSQNNIDDLVFEKLNEFLLYNKELQKKLKPLYREIETLKRKLHKLDKNNAVEINNIEKEIYKLEEQIEVIKKETNDKYNKYVNFLTQNKIDPDKEIEKFEYLSNEVYKVKGRSSVCNKCLKKFKTNKLSINKINAYFCPDCYKDTVEDYDLSNNSINKTLEKNKIHKCHHCEVHINNITRRTVYLIDEGIYVKYCNNCYNEYIDDLKDYEEYKIGKRKRIYSWILLVLFGVLGFFLISFLSKEYDFDFTTKLISIVSVILIYCSFACRILENNFVFKISNFFTTIYSKLYRLLWGERSYKETFVQNKTGKGFFYALIFAILLGIIYIVWYLVIWTIFFIVKLIVTIPFSIFYLPFAYIRSKRRFDLYEFNPDPEE